MYSVFRKFIRATVAVLVFCLQAHAEVVVIVSSENPLAHLQRQTVREIYLGNQLYWDDGKRAIPVRLPEGATSSEFFSAFVNVSETEYNSFWRRRLFSGKAIPPKKLPNENAVIDYITNNRGAIGYVSRKSTENRPGVKVLPLE